VTIQYKKNQAILIGTVSVEDAEPLLEWLQKKTAAKVDLSNCSHLHPANLQVIMAASPTITAWPADSQFADWLKNALQKVE
jgi:preprotein translocase subunit SecA